VVSDRYAVVLPTILAWIRQTLEAHSHLKRPVASFGFRRLPQYFSTAILNSASVVVVDPLPVPPLSELGLTEFPDLEMATKGGVTYRDTSILQPACARSESVHFHELVHVIQWAVLGPERFLLLYADGFDRFGYRLCPLEAMAYDQQRRFDAWEPPYPVEEEVRTQTMALLA